MAKPILDQPLPNLKANRPIIDVIQYAMGYGVLRDHINQAHRLAHQVIEAVKPSDMEPKIHYALVTLVEYLDKSHAIINRSTAGSL